MSMQGKTVLIVEDEAPLRNALKDAFTHEGFTTQEAANGAEGLAFALTLKPDVIILDLMMPIMDGQTMIKELRADEAYGKNADIIVLTNVGILNEEAKQVNMEVPAFYLTKSNWDVAAVVEKAKVLIARHHQ